jgi:hypothetical protein
MRLLSIYFLFVSYTVFGQISGGNGSILGTLDPNFLNSDLVFSKELYAEFDGSPYLFEDFSEGCLYLYDGSELCDVKINYDTYQKSIVVIKDEKDGLIYLKPEFIKEFQILGTDYQSLAISSDYLKTFVKIIYSSDQLSIYEYKEIELKYRDTQGNTGYTSTNKNSKYFSSSNDFVMRYVGKVYNDRKLSKLLKNLTDYDLLKVFAKSQDLDLSEGADVKVALKNYKN